MGIDFDLLFKVGGGKFERLEPEMNKVVNVLSPVLFLHSDPVVDHISFLENVANLTLSVCVAFIPSHASVTSADEMAILKLFPRESFRAGDAAMFFISSSYPLGIHFVELCLELGDRFFLH